MRVKSFFWISIADFFMLFSNKFSPTKKRNWAFRRLGMTIGEPVIIDKNFTFWDASTISIGNKVLIRENCYFDHHIQVGDFCTFSRDVIILTAGHDPHDLSYKMSPVKIDDFVWIGAKALILPGVHIGERAVVAAGAVVTKDVPSFTLVGGNPARFIKNIEERQYYYHQFEKVSIK